jgi:SAM-dependent methyltransferase
MSDPAETNRLISHSIAPLAVAQLIKEKTAQILHAGDLPHVTAQRQIEILNQLGEFDFGRFLLQNKGINGYWTHYMLTYPRQNSPVTANPIEKFLLERAPTILATQERFDLFLRENQLAVANNRQLASIPSGMMGELLYLNFSEISQIQLVGIDYDVSALDDAKKLAAKQNLMKFSSFKQSDAWNLRLHNEFDLISSNGLNIYEPDDNRVTSLYQQFYAALKPGGKLVTSFLTPPPGLNEFCEWTMTEVNADDSLLQKIIFADVLGVKWQCFRSTQQTREQLELAGFKAICFISDRANIFPTVTAYK